MWATLPELLHEVAKVTPTASTLSPIELHCPQCVQKRTSALAGTQGVRTFIPDIPNPSACTGSHFDCIGGCCNLRALALGIAWAQVCCADNPVYPLNDEPPELSTNKAAVGISGCCPVHVALTCRVCEKCRGLLCWQTVHLFCSVRVDLRSDTLKRSQVAMCRRRRNSCYLS